MSEATIAIGVKLARGNGAEPEVFTKMAEVTDIDGPKRAANPVNVTNMDSPGGYEESKPGLKQGGSVGFTANYVAEDPTQDALETDFDTNRIGNWQLDLNDATETLDVSTVYDFKAYVEDLGPAIRVGEVITQSGTLRVVGKPTKAKRHAAP